MSCDQQLSPLSYEDGMDEMDTSSPTEIKIDSFSLIHSDTPVDAIDLITANDIPQDGNYKFNNVNINNYSVKKYYSL